MRIETTARTIVICGLCSLALLPGCGFIPGLLGEGSISEVSPVEGTVGTELTISGSNLGSATGEVLLGDTQLKVISWSPTQIVARITEVLPAGDYDITAKTIWMAPVTYSSFTVQAPLLNSLAFRPQFLSGGETMTVTGKWFGSKAGIALLQNEQESVTTDVLDWSTDSVNIQVPTGLSGMWNLTVSNGVGEATEPHWATFEPLPEGASSGPVAETEMPGNTNNTHDAPSAIQFEGALWVFGAGDDDNIRANAYVNGSSSLTDMPDPPGETYTQMAPLIVNGVLWLFNTAKNGTIEYFKYNSTAKTWSSAVKVPNVSTVNDYPVGAAYNDSDPYHRIELFYYNDGKIYRTYTDNSGQSWSSPTAVISGAGFGPSALFWQNAVYWDSTKSIQLPFVTLVSYQTASTLQVDWVQDGRRLYSQTVYSVNGTMGGFHPYLVDLGEDYIAVTHGDQNCQPAIREMAKATGKWQNRWNPVAYTNYSACFNTTGAVGVTKIADAGSQGGYRYDTYFYIFWGKNNDKLFSKDYWVRTQVEYLGYYTEPSPPVPTSFADQLKDTFYLWPVIGILDAPPFVLNGHPIDEYDCIPSTECARAEFGTAVGSEVAIDLEASIGPYVESGEKSPVKLEVSAEVSASINAEVTKTEKRVDTLFRSEEGNVLILYLTPDVQTHTYNWYNHDKQPTGKSFHVIELIRLKIGSMIFDPRESPCGTDCVNMPPSYWTSFPTHGATDDVTRLNTYNTVPAEPYLFNSSGDWNSGGEGQIIWTYDASKTISLGLDIEFKVGKGGVIGGGVEGSFNLHGSSKTSVLTDANTYLLNPDAATVGDIRRFSVDGYWLSPNSAGYWVPVNRQGMGDQPWFITYKVGGILYKE